MMLGDEWDLDHIHGHLPGPERDDTDDHEWQVARQEREQCDRHQAHAACHHLATADPVRDGTRRKGNQEARELRHGHQPGHRPAQPDRLEIQVEVDPVEAQSRAEDDRRQQEEPRVAAESRESLEVAGEGSGHLESRA